MRIAIENLPSATMVPNEFIDRYMPAANGEYVKVFLYLLRHAGGEITPARIADALDLTEGDVRRALTRWQREGLISFPQTSGEAAPAVPAASQVQEIPEEYPGQIPETAAVHTAAPAFPPAVTQQDPPAAPVQTQAAAPARQAVPVQTQAAAPARQAVPVQTQAAAPARQGVPVQTQTVPTQPQQAASAQPAVPVQPQQAAPVQQTAPARQAIPVQTAAPVQQAVPVQPQTVAQEELPPRTAADFRKLRKDEEFTTLLYVLQRYIGMIFSQTNNEAVAYLYDTLGMSSDLLIYTAEICAERKQRAEAEGRRTADRDWFRYFEKTAIRFHKKGIRTAEEAREDDTRYRAAIHTVMNTFGKDCSYPGQAERALIDKWYNEYRFSAEVIGEACSIVKLSTGGISYSYADKILNSWHEAGIRTVEQAKEFEARRKEGGTGNGAAARRNSPQRNSSGRTVTRFHNLEERDDDLDAYALQKMKKELEEV